jgi:hypothetical protein
LLNREKPGSEKYFKGQVFLLVRLISSDEPIAESFMIWFNEG